MGEDVLGVALRYLFTIDGFVAGYENRHFATVVVSDG
jgi:hypothetical protein